MPAMKTIQPGRLRCLGAWLVWILAVYVAYVVAMRFQLFPEVAQSERFLPGLIGRSLGDPFYGFLISGLIASHIYGFILLGLTRWGAVSNPFLSRLVGVASPEQQQQFDARLTAFAIARSPLRDAVTLFPGLGFLGTVIGVSVAIGGLEDVMAGQPPTELIDGLRTAFDTTFIGLIASLMLTLLLMATDQSAVFRHGEGSATDAN